MKKYRAGSPGRGAARETKAFQSFPLTVPFGDLKDSQRKPLGHPTQEDLLTYI